jgi:hypothetical protein
LTNPHPVAPRASLRGLLPALALAACGVGSVEPGGGGDRDPGAADGGDALDDGDAPDAAPVACDEPIADVGGGEHNPGQACLNGACHGPGGEGPTFRVGGTIYDALTGGAPVAGASIHLRDADGVEVVAESARNGNFWVEEDLAFPLTTFASRCPDTLAMAAPLAAAGGGNCNAAGCHDGDFRIHLP